MYSTAQQAYVFLMEYGNLVGGMIIGVITLVLAIFILVSWMGKRREANVRHERLVAFQAEFKFPASSFSSHSARIVQSAKDAVNQHLHVLAYYLDQTIGEQAAVEKSMGPGPDKVQKLRQAEEAIEKAKKDFWKAWHIARNVTQEHQFFMPDSYKPYLEVRHPLSPA